MTFCLLQQIKRELLDSQHKVSSLQELSAQLLVTTKPQTLLMQSETSEQIKPLATECLEAQEKVHVIKNRQRLLLREVNSDLEGLERRLEAVDVQQVREDLNQTKLFLISPLNIWPVFHPTHPFSKFKSLTVVLF